MKYLTILLSLLPAGFIAQPATAQGTSALDTANDGRANVAIIRQGGSGGNSVSITQSGSDNVADVFQEGENNVADVTQEGTENRLDAKQTGANNTLKRKQTGHSVTKIEQNGNAATIESNGTVEETHSN